MGGCVVKSGGAAVDTARVEGPPCSCSRLSGGREGGESMPPLDVPAAAATAAATPAAASRAGLSLTGCEVTSRLTRKPWLPEGPLGLRRTQPFDGLRASTFLAALLPGDPRVRNFTLICSSRIASVSRPPNLEAACLSLGSRHERSSSSCAGAGASPSNLHLRC
ncbi:hypothetical protein Agub_g3081 [Astrephomene gubernaculifera]|uniref:Uncharacterized protein n=1 Tax=Astrephomene gubernaculifera TaxID=47775 RepID=A0AAD3DHZ6_9CHLO|nr:hypothetical protein Agub_g3081 [Astrephomene gubernaculifera]